MLPCNVIVQQHADGSVEVSLPSILSSLCSQSRIRAWPRSPTRFGRSLRGRRRTLSPLRFSSALGSIATLVAAHDVGPSSLTDRGNLKFNPRTKVAECEAAKKVMHPRIDCEVRCGASCVSNSELSQD